MIQTSSFTYIMIINNNNNKNNKNNNSTQSPRFPTNEVEASLELRPSPWAISAPQDEFFEPSRTRRPLVPAGPLYRDSGHPAVKDPTATESKLRPIRKKLFQDETSRFDGSCGFWKLNHLEPPQKKNRRPP